MIEANVPENPTLFSPKANAITTMPHQNNSN
jgi:hypothetical protein